MPIEIREITIKTEIVTGERNHPQRFRDKEVHTLKRQLLEECKTMIAREVEKKNIYKR